MRPYETVEPPSKRTGFPIDATIADENFEVLAADLLADAAYVNKLAVVAWHHGYIPQFAQKLGVAAGACPDRWPQGVFDLVLRFDFGTAPLPVVTQVKESS